MLLCKHKERSLKSVVLLNNVYDNQSRFLKWVHMTRNCQFTWQSHGYPPYYNQGRAKLCLRFSLCDGGSSKIQFYIRVLDKFLKDS
jgi:hypothetical protein